MPAHSREAWFHADRIAGRHRHHRGPYRAVAARGPGRPRGRPTRPVHQQTSSRSACDPQLLSVNDSMPPACIPKSSPSPPSPAAPVLSSRRCTTPSTSRGRTLQNRHQCPETTSASSGRAGDSGPATSGRDQRVGHANQINSFLCPSDTDWEPHKIYFNGNGQYIGRTSYPPQRHQPLRREWGRAQRPVSPHLRP